MSKGVFGTKANQSFKHCLLLAMLSVSFVISGCGSENDTEVVEDDIVIEVPSDDSSDESTEEYADNNFEATDWSDTTHSKDADPDFDEVFDNTQVKRLDFVVTTERWQSMLDDMTERYGEFGQRSGAPGSTNSDSDLDENPIFVPSDVYYNDKQWYRVGIRFKGNSSLQSSWEQGILKLSFKLDFDEFEDEYPQIKNQRFYGFKKFSLKNNYDDNSQLREKVASDVFKRAGLAVSNTAFYTLYVDHGNGPEYFGLYTLVEEIDDTVIDTQFTDDNGNLYKPEDDGSSFVEGSFSQENFEKKTNEDDEDWSDILALFDALHDETRITEPATWRANLEAVFDVDGFLKYLAVNGIIQNWDTYGRMPHNFYLYNNPETSTLTWIPWDNNEALQEGKMGGALTLNFSNLESSNWPLIAKLYADDVYKTRYNNYLQEVINDSFETNTIQAIYADYSALIAPYATTEESGFSFLNSSNDFYQAIEQLNEHAESRADAVEAYLTTQ
ncbi:CotH kinase family protein [Thalassotalea piscium]